MAYIGHFEHLPARNSTVSPRFDRRSFERWSYYVVLGAIALAPIVAPLLVKHYGF